MHTKPLYFLPLLAVAFNSYAQKTNWQNLDLKQDSVFGISTEKAYTQLLKGKKAQPVIAAVIDAGIDTAHEDLKAVLWHNPKKNAPDRYGWNYIGSVKGNVTLDNLEVTRQVRQQQSRFSGKDSSQIAAKDMPAYRLYLKEKADLDAQLAAAQRPLAGIGGFKAVLDGMIQKIGTAEPTLADLETFQPNGPGETKVKQVLTEVMRKDPDLKKFIADNLNGPISHYREQVDYQLNLNFDPRAELVGDDYFNAQQNDYGNSNIAAGVPTHGTHVAGIIGAVRDNGLGIKGVADHVLLMGIRAVPEGDERDKDIANAIRYAADHGAKVINMSFGKPYSQDKAAVDAAVRYALKKDVLLIQAAGNSNENIDSVANFPNRKYLDGTEAPAWIVVGASGWKDDETLKAPFSNYGKTGVDVFAPGVQINSSIPGSQYAAFDGTSMAAPVVAGLACLLREYYPKLKAQQIKSIILYSAQPVTHNVILEAGKTKRKVPFTELCRTGGIVNAYAALLFAEQVAQGHVKI